MKYWVIVLQYFLNVMKILIIMPQLSAIQFFVDSALFKQTNCFSGKQLWILKREHCEKFKNFSIFTWVWERGWISYQILSIRLLSLTLIIQWIFVEMAGYFFQSVWLGNSLALCLKTCGKFVRVNVSFPAWFWFQIVGEKHLINYPELRKNFAQIQVSTVTPKLLNWKQEQQNSFLLTHIQLDTRRNVSNTMENILSHIYVL